MGVAAGLAEAEANVTVLAAEGGEAIGADAAAGSRAGSRRTRAYAYGSQGRTYRTAPPVVPGSLPGGRQYQGVILAEFLAAIVITAFLPLATGGSANAQAKGGPSPYDTGDVKRFAGIGATYFVLALLSSGSKGRLAAWFGGLILLVILLNRVGDIKTATQNLAAPPQTGMPPTEPPGGSKAGEAQSGGGVVT